MIIAKNFTVYNKLCKGDMSQHPKMARMFLGLNYHVFNSRFTDEVFCYKICCFLVDLVSKFLCVVLSSQLYSLFSEYLRMGNEDWCKDLSVIPFANVVIAVYLPNFVTMATRVGYGII